MISRDPNGKIDIVNVEQSNQESKPKSELKQHMINTEESADVTAGTNTAFPQDKSPSSIHARNISQTEKVS